MNGKREIGGTWSRRGVRGMLLLAAAGLACARPPSSPEPESPAVSPPPVADPCAGPEADRPADCPRLPPGAGESAIGETAILDSDRDGIDDVSDACPAEPEDFDGFADGDGCPDLLEQTSPPTPFVPPLQERHPPQDSRILE